jgi:hypothetical protein
MTATTKKTVKKTKEFDYKTIKSFEDACKKLGIDQGAPMTGLILEELKKPIIAAYKLMVIYMAINNGWKPDWSNYNQGKYYPWFEVLSSGFGFSGSSFGYILTITCVGSRLCTDTLEKALYIGKQFETEYKDFFLYSE